jgi:hypothetical protein
VIASTQQTTKVFFTSFAMNTFTSIELNQRGCFFLSQGSVAEGLKEFKKALSVLKKELNDQSKDVLHLHSAPKPLYHEHEVTAGTSGDWFCWLIPAPEVSKQERERFWIFSRPLSMQRVVEGSGHILCSNADVFTISFNVALASHLQGVEQELEGDYDQAIDSFIVAVKMYQLTLSQANYERNGSTINILSGELYAAIFNNLAHVHAMSSESIHSTAFAEQLLQTLFYLVLSGHVTTVHEVTTHKMLLENAHCLLMSPSNSAAAA